MPKKHSLFLNTSLASAAKKAKLSLDFSKTSQEESPTFLKTLLTNLKTFTLRRKKKVTERPTSSPYPETTYSTHVKNNKPTVDNYQGKKTAQIIQFLKDLPNPVTIQEIGRPIQGAQANVKFIEIYSPKHTRKLPVAYKQGGKSTENEVKIHTAIAVNHYAPKGGSFINA